MRVRAWSTTISVCTQTSPSGCHSGSCGQPTSACSSGNSRSTTPSSSASARPIEGRAAGAAASRIRPRCVPPAGRRAGSRGRSSRVVGSSVNSNRAANCTARSTRRLSSPNVARIDGAQHARARDRARPSNGSRYSPVSGSQAIALIVKSRRRAASSSVIVGSPVTVEALVAAAGLRFAARQRHVDVARPCRPVKLSPTVFTRPNGVEQAVQRGAGQAEDLDVDVLGVAAEQPVAHPAADDERAAAGVADACTRSRRRPSARLGVRP